MKNEQGERKVSMPLVVASFYAWCAVLMFMSSQARLSPTMGTAGEMLCSLIFWMCVAVFVVITIGIGYVFVSAFIVTGKKVEDHDRIIYIESDFEEEEEEDLPDIFPVSYSRPPYEGMVSLSRDYHYEGPEEDESDDDPVYH